MGGAGGENKGAAGTRAAAVSPAVPSPARVDVVGDGVLRGAHLLRAGAAPSLHRRNAPAAARCRLPRTPETSQREVVPSRSLAWRFGGWGGRGGGGGGGDEVKHDSGGDKDTLPATSATSVVTLVPSRRG